uniref:Uncharacterized protein n=1 Tax=Glossina austeni TaxID=7395 RepID=A0A1A9VXH0_GLOAU
MKSAWFRKAALLKASKGIHVCDESALESSSKNAYHIVGQIKTTAITTTFITKIEKFCLHFKDAEISEISIVAFTKRMQTAVHLGIKEALGLNNKDSLVINKIVNDNAMVEIRLMMNGTVLSAKLLHNMWRGRKEVRNSFCIEIIEGEGNSLMTDQQSSMFIRRLLNIF